MGKLYDDRGNRMTPTHANKRGVRYRYYVSSALSQSRLAGSVERVSAAAIESAIIRVLRERYPERGTLDDRHLVAASVDKIVLRDTALEITILTEMDGLACSTEGASVHQTQAGEDESDRSGPAPTTLTVSWTRAPARSRREIIVSNSTPDVRPIRAETRTTLVRSIALGRRWLQEIVDGSAASPDAIAVRESCSRRHVAMMISLAFLAPDLVRAAMDGRLPRGIGVSRLVDAPIEWSRQWRMLGL